MMVVFACVAVCVFLAAMLALVAMVAKLLYGDEKSRGSGHMMKVLPAGRIKIKRYRGPINYMDGFSNDGK